MTCLLVLGYFSFEAGVCLAQHSIYSIERLEWVIPKVHLSFKDMLDVWRRWKNDSAFMNTCCFSRGSKFSSLYAYLEVHK